MNTPRHSSVITESKFYSISKKMAVELETKETNLSTSTAQIGDHRERWVEVRLYRRGMGPIAVSKCALVGAGSDRLDVRSILSRHGLRSLFAFKPPAERGFRIRFDPGSGQSVHHYKPGSVVCFDSEPKSSLIRPILIIFMGVAIPAILLAVLVNEFPHQLKSKMLFGSFFPPWLLALGVILYTRMRKKPGI